MAVRLTIFSMLIFEFLTVRWLLVSYSGRLVRRVFVLDLVGVGLLISSFAMRNACVRASIFLHCALSIN